MKKKNLVELAEEMNFNVGYNEEAKREFARLGRSFLRKVEELLLDQGIDEVSRDYNSGGIAVSGEVTLKGLYPGHAGGFYVQISLFSGSYGFFRATKGLMDYSGGRNRPLVESEILSPENLVAQLLGSSMKEEAIELVS